MVAPAREWKFESSPAHDSKIAPDKSGAILFVSVGKICYYFISIIMFNRTMQIIFGLIVALLGIGVVFKTEWILENFGTNTWAEDTLGTSGGSRLLYKLIGLIMIFFGFLLITGLFQSFLMGTIGKIFIR